MLNLVKQIINFVCTSGIGFIIDFSFYYFLSTYANVSISYSNMISAIPAVTYVFIVSNRKIFNCTKKKYPVYSKYIIYILYQVVLVTIVSVLAQVIFENAYSVINEKINFITEGKCKILVKCFITPITMICNFLVMKFLCEKM